MSTQTNRAVLESLFGGDTVTLSADHRVLDGVIAAEFLQELKLALENPVRLLL